MSIFICTGNKDKAIEFKKLLGNKSSVYSIKDLKKYLSVNYVEPHENSSYFLANGFVKVFSALKYIMHQLGKNLPPINEILVDDSGLCVPCLNFLPGVNSANFAGEPRDDLKNRIKLIENIFHSKESYNYNNEKRCEGFFVCFLFSVSLKENLNFIKKYECSEALDFVNKALVSFEKRILKEINLEKSGDSFSKKLSFSLFHKDFPQDIFLNLHCGYCVGEVSNFEQNLIPDAGHGYDSLFYSKKNRNFSFASISLDEKNKQSHRGLALREFLKGRS